jgi:hypothetical protein
MPTCDPRDIVQAPDGPYTLRNDNQPNAITCMAGGAEMLKVSDKGFWVRGVKVEQDEKEAQKVYEAFKAWMMWAQMTRDYQ